MGKVYIEETLASDAVDTALVNSPYLIHSEVLEGARRPLAFLQLVSENFDLIGAVGYTIKFLLASQLTATSITEANMLSAGMVGTSDKTLSMVSVSVPDVIYVCVQLSDILAEDFPNVDWVRLHLRNMGKAVMEYIDAQIETVLAGASSSAITVIDDIATLDYSEVVDAVAAMENIDWIVDPNDPPYLVVSPDMAAGLVKDTDFVSTERYTTYEISKMVQGELGKFASLRVLKSSLLDGTGYGFIVFPESTNGVVLTLAWKRRLEVKNERFEKYGYTYFNTTCRCAPAIIQGKGICRLEVTDSP